MHHDQRGGGADGTHSDLNPQGDGSSGRLDAQKIDRGRARWATQHSEAKSNLPWGLGPAIREEPVSYGPEQFGETACTVVIFVCIKVPRASGVLHC